MGVDLKQQMEKALEGKVMYEGYTKHIEGLQQQIREVENTLIHLECAYEKEAKDVNKLEQASLSTFLIKVSGKYDKALEKENKEAEIARLNWEQNKEKLKQLKKQVEDLKKERITYASCEADYKKLYAMRLESLQTQGGDVSERLRAIEETIATMTIQTKEIQEALSAGRRVINTLEQAKQYLDKAAGWGTFDILGGGMVSDLAKHSNLDSAKSYIEEAQRLMRDFKAELSDVGEIYLNIHMDISSFAKFADFIFDGFFADIYMQDRIREAQNSVAAAQEQVSGVCHQLGDLLRQAKETVRNSANEKDNLVRA